jgi:hypothetical protein
LQYQDQLNQPLLKNVPHATHLLVGHTVSVAK